MIINIKDLTRQLDEQIEKRKNVKFEMSDDEKIEYERKKKYTNETLDSVIAKIDKMLDLLETSK